MSLYVCLYMYVSIVYSNKVDWHIFIFFKILYEGTCQMLD